jgi:hypothetical protein
MLEAMLGVPSPDEGEDEPRAENRSLASIASAMVEAFDADPEEDEDEGPSSSDLSSELSVDFDDEDEDEDEGDKSTGAKPETSAKGSGTFSSEEDDYRLRTLDDLEEDPPFEPDEDEDDGVDSEETDGEEVDRSVVESSDDEEEEDEDDPTPGIDEEFARPRPIGLEGDDDDDDDDDEGVAFEEPKDW